MSFGIPEAGILARSTNNSVDAVDKLNEVGEIIEQHTTGGTTEITETQYTDLFANTAVNGQEATSVITGHNLTEVNNDYAKEEITTRTALAAS